MKKRMRVSIQSLSISLRRFLGKLWKTRAEKARGVGVKPYVNRIISDAILLNEIPSPTEREEQRVGFITGRLNDFGVSNVTVDDAGNAVALWPASRPSDEYVLLFSDIENEAYSPLESLVKFSGERARGIGIADNSLGAATLLVLAEYLQNNGIFYDKNLVFLFTSFSSSAGSSFAALERFIRGWKGGIVAALYVAGLQLGSIEAKPLGNCKLTVTVKTAQRTLFPYAGGFSATAVLSSIAFQLGSIKWDEHNETTVNIARFLAGVGYGYFPSEGVMELEIYSGNMNALEMSKNAVSATIQKIAREMGAQVDIAVNSLIPVGDSVRNQALIESLKKVHGELRIRTTFVSTPDKTAVLNAFGIPAIYVGITNGKKALDEEYIDLPPVEKGFEQLRMLLGRVASQG
jgi:acetylornithine deacetylase/succinyl-diaminopimelate desuccinylase-like protein